MISHLEQHLEATDAERSIAAAVIRDRLHQFKTHSSCARFFGVSETELFQAQYRTRDDSRKEICPTEAIRKINSRALDLTLLTIGG